VKWQANATNRLIALGKSRNRSLYNFYLSSISKAHLVHSGTSHASRLGEIPDVAGAIVERPFSSPMKFLFCSSNLCNAETHIACSPPDLPCWDTALGGLLQTGKDFADSVAPSGPYVRLAHVKHAPCLGQLTKVVRSERRLDTSSS
jgi:hypothetical protein